MENVRKLPFSVKRTISDWVNIVNITNEYKLFDEEATFPSLGFWLYNLESPLIIQRIYL